MSKVAKKKSKGVHETPKTKVDHRHVRIAVKLHTRMTGLEKLKAGWVDLKHDVKDAVSTLPALQKEFAMMKAMLRAGLGDQPISLRMSATLVVTTTVTTGVTNTVSVGGGTGGLIDISRFSEFGAIAGLFDLVQVDGFSVELIYNNFNVQGTTMTVDSIARMGYEVEGTSTPAVSSEEIAQLAHNKAIPPKFVGVATSNTGVTSDAIHRLAFPTPTGSAFPTLTPAQGNPGRSWVSIDSATPGSGPFYGAFRFYHIGALVTAINSGVGLMYAHCKFKCRQ
jgi:hypothetical protein